MIDLEYNYNKPEPNIHQKVAEALVAAFHNSGLETAVINAPDVEECCLQSPILKLVKERNEARRMCEILAAAMPDLVAVKTSQKACDAANAEMHQAIMTYVKLRKDWDERSWQ
jgi:hypothetical protein